MSELSKVLDEIEARCNVATPGPWRAVHDDNNYEHTVLTKSAFICETTYDQQSSSMKGTAYKEDAEFIAHSRTDVERLVKALRVLTQCCITIRENPDWLDNGARAHGNLIKAAAILKGNTTGA